MADARTWAREVRKCLAALTKLAATGTERFPRTRAAIEALSEASQTELTPHVLRQRRRRQSLHFLEAAERVQLCRLRQTVQKLRAE
eukprot:9854981-Lingulodinium_polyedra.AAC.1